MRNDQSTFIQELGYLIDEFDELQDLRWSDLQYLAEYRELKMKKNDGLPIDQVKLDQLEPLFKNKIVTASRWNKFQNALVGMQKFIKDEVEGFVLDKQQEMQLFVDGKQAYIVEFVDGRVRLINNTVSEGINTMSDKRDYFIAFVNTKTDEVREIIQEFDSNSARYYTIWTATQGQLDFNIFQGSNKNIPPEANLNIATENIDLVINGVLQTPYTDFVIHNNGFYDTIRLTANSQSLIQDGTEIVARWYKNVGKLYFKHAHSHGEGGRDSLTVTKGMLDINLKEQLMYIPFRGNLPPDPKERKLWLDTSI
ncbi:hypothetical protein [Tissierella pigra]|uniref:Uncharacterized protein n=1 Tax=Tissierella pigra TaxID=2607614 RepID=A0A6N7XZC2_9FIRM|nr:hypothetical protein [Tissierella pigra]MSU01924.1 hypothetical protein [Tissierella pigra]